MAKDTTISIGFTIHIPKKLARRGYLWSVHYNGQIGTLINSENKRSYLALFGGVLTRTFLDSSPAELRGMQVDFTREMMGTCLLSKGDVFALEWSVNGSKNVQEPMSMQIDFFPSVPTAMMKRWEPGQQKVYHHCCRLLSLMAQKHIS